MSHSGAVALIYTVHHLYNFDELGTWQQNCIIRFTFRTNTAAIQAADLAFLPDRFLFNFCAIPIHGSGACIQY